MKCVWDLMRNCIFLIKLVIQLIYGISYNDKENNDLVSSMYYMDI